MCNHIHACRLFKETWERKKPNGCETKKMTVYGYYLAFLSCVLFLSHSLREEHEFFIRGGAFNRTSGRECMFVHMCIRMRGECMTKSLPWDAVDIHTLEIWANMRGSARREWMCARVLPGNLSSRVEVQCSHWLQHLHTAHILQQRQRRQNLHLTHFQCETSNHNSKHRMQLSVAQLPCVKIIELATHLQCMWLSVCECVCVCSLWELML